MAAAIIDFTIKSDCKCDIALIDAMLSKMTGLFSDYSFVESEGIIHVHDEGMSLDYLKKCIKGIDCLLTQNDVNGVLFTIYGNIDYDCGNYSLFEIAYDNGVASIKEIGYSVENVFDEESYDAAVFMAEKMIAKEPSCRMDLKQYDDPMHMDNASQSVKEYLKAHPYTSKKQKKTVNKDDIDDMKPTIEEMIAISEIIKPKMEELGVADSERLDDYEEANLAMQNPRDYELLLQAENVLPNAEKVPQELSHEKAFSICPRTKLFAEMGDELAKRILNNYYECFGAYPWE